MQIFHHYPFSSKFSSKSHFVLLRFIYWDSFPNPLHILKPDELASCYIGKGVPGIEELENKACKFISNFDVSEGPWKNIELYLMLFEKVKLFSRS